jgi:hypothetical protein
MKKFKKSEGSYAAAFREIGTLRRVLMEYRRLKDGWWFAGDPDETGSTGKRANRSMIREKREAIP